MVAANEVHKGDIGTVFRPTVKDDGTAVDVSSASTISLRFRKPDLTEIARTGSFTSDGTNGKVQYTTVSGDLDQSGQWECQVYLVMTGFTGYSTRFKFHVYEVIDP